MCFASDFLCGFKLLSRFCDLLFFTFMPCSSLIPFSLQLTCLFLGVALLYLKACLPVFELSHLLFGLKFLPSSICSQFLTLGCSSLSFTGRSFLNLFLLRSIIRSFFGFLFLCLSPC